MKKIIEFLLSIITTLHFKIGYKKSRCTLYPIVCILSILRYGLYYPMIKLYWDNDLNVSNRDFYVMIEETHYNNYIYVGHINYSKSLNNFSLKDIEL